MADNTKNYGLVKPAAIEKVDIAVINGNMDKIDAALNDVKTGADFLEELIEEEISRITLAEQTLGCSAKNLLRNNCNTATKNDVTATVNDDGSITLSGANTAGSDFVIFYNLETGSADSNTQFVNNKKFLPNGRYFVSGGVTGCGIQVCVSPDNLTAPVKATAYASKETFTITDIDKYVWGRLIISNNADFSTPVTIYPMIRRSEITDDTYEPYKPSVEERLAALEEKLTALEGGAA